MFLRHTAKNEAAAIQIETAIDAALCEGYRTRDIAGGSEKIVSTSEMGGIIARYATAGAHTSAAVQ
jgi:3-isopropylmalate dehydrogenase